MLLFSLSVCVNNNNYRLSIPIRRRSLSQLVDLAGITSSVQDIHTSPTALFRLLSSFLARQVQLTWNMPESGHQGTVMSAIPWEDHEATLIDIFFHRSIDVWMTYHRSLTWNSLVHVHLLVKKRYVTDTDDPLTFQMISLSQKGTLESSSPLGTASFLIGNTTQVQKYTVGFLLSPNETGQCTALITTNATKETIPFQLTLSTSLDCSKIT